MSPDFTPISNTISVTLDIELKFIIPLSSIPAGQTCLETTTTKQQVVDIDAMSCDHNSASLHPLITQNLVNTKKFYCPFLERGYCRDNTKCNFSHDLDNSIKIPTDYCHFYLANQCLYGLDCKFRHVEPSIGSTSTATNLSSLSSSSSSTAPSAKTSSTTNTYNDPTTSNTSTIPYSTNYWPQSDNNNQQYYDYSSVDQASYITQGDHYDNYQAEDDHQPSFGQLSYRFSSSLPALPTSSNHFASATNQNISSEPLIHQQQLHRNNNHYHHRSIGHINVVSSDLLLLICDLCSRPCLEPHDLDQQRQHREECLREHEREMELSFAIQRSKDKVCGICMDVVLEKKPVTSSRFGILEKCSHIFCLDCIRKWRGTKQFETRTIR